MEKIVNEILDELLPMLGIDPNMGLGRPIAESYLSDKLTKYFSDQASSVGVQPEVMPNERELIDHYNNKESQEWLNASLGKQQASGAVAGHWQDNKPDRPCYFVYRDDENDNYPNLYEAVLEDNILTVYNIQDDEYIYSMEEMADGQFFIVEK